MVHTTAYKLANVYEMSASFQKYAYNIVTTTLLYKSTVNKLNFSVNLQDINVY